MNRFADLLDGLVFMPSRNGKLTLLGDYFRTTPDPDRGWALAALAGTLDLKTAKPALLRELIGERTDPELFRWSYDYVGDLAETCALMWPSADQAGGQGAAPSLGEVVTALNATGRAGVPALLTAWLDALDATGRWALLKLVTGGLRVGVSARLAKTAFATAFDKPVAEVEELWHGLAPPYQPLFAWGEGRADKPDIAALPVFRPFMLAHPLEDGDRLDPSAFFAEWKWDGIRVQVVAQGSDRRLYSRAGDDISRAFPDVVEAIACEGIFDGELLVRGDDGSVAPFNHLQQRLNRKTVGRTLLARHPAFVRLYDVLFDGRQDVRGRPLTERRPILEGRAAHLPPERFDLSDLLTVRDWAELEALRARARSAGMEGLMLKRRDAPYTAGRQKGLWYKWKRDPLTADLVLMYAQRGHGKRSSFYSDYTFGAWSGDGLLPVGKAYSGFTDDELVMLDRWVRGHTTNRFGPVREVEKALVLEVAFDSIHASKRHKSGLAMRFPRIKRIRADKPAAEADRLETLAALAQG